MKSRRSWPAWAILSTGALLLLARQSGMHLLDVQKFFRVIHTGWIAVGVSGFSPEPRWLPSTPTDSLAILAPGWPSTGTAVFAIVLSVMVLIALAYLRVRRPEPGRKRLETAAPVEGSKLESADVESQDASLADPLTGVRSRRFFHSTISADADQAARAYFSDAENYSRDHRDLIFYLIDLDQFKVINETFGEKAGDEILVEAARRLSRIVRSSDFLIRWGGEEFLVVCRAAERRNGRILAEKILAALAEKPFSISGGNQVIRTCSIGWAPFPWEPGTDSRTVEEVLKLAERGLSRAKELGRNQAVGMLPPVPAEVKVGVIEAERNGEARSGTERELISPGPRWV